MPSDAFDTVIAKKVVKTSKAKRDAVIVLFAESEERLIALPLEQASVDNLNKETSNFGIEVSPGLILYVILY